MGEPLKKCPVCSGRGYFHCECWPGDCICAYGDEDCEICEATGLIYPEDEDDLYETEPSSTMEQSE